MIKLKVYNGQVKSLNTFSVAFLAMFIAQFLKIFTARPFSVSRIMGSGGMPSSHSSFVSSLATIIGLKYGFQSDLFAITTVFSLITMYDATGVRRAVGKQANILNHLIRDIGANENKKVIYGELKELIGHTPKEVLAGAFLGISIALLLH